MSTAAFGGDRRPTNISGRTAGRSTISRRALFAFSFPATSLNTVNITFKTESLTLAWFLCLACTSRPKHAE